MGLLALVTGKRGASGFGSSSTAEEVTRGIDAAHLTAIVTGGASGIGAETVRVLASRGARVVIAARNVEAGNAVKDEILKEIKGARIDVLRLDLASTESVKKFVEDFDALDLPLNILINNAGIMFCPFKLSEDGLEMHFATNHLGEGLIYESADGLNFFPHFYGPSRIFAPLALGAIIEAEKVELIDGKFVLPF